MPRHMWPESTEKQVRVVHNDVSRHFGAMRRSSAGGLLASPVSGIAGLGKKDLRPDTRAWDSPLLEVADECRDVGEGFGLQPIRQALLNVGGNVIGIKALGRRTIDPRESRPEDRLLGFHRADFERKDTVVETFQNIEMPTNPLVLLDNTKPIVLRSKGSTIRGIPGSASEWLWLRESGAAIILFVDAGLRVTRVAERSSCHSGCSIGRPVLACGLLLSRWSELPTLQIYESFFGSWRAARLRRR